MSDTITKTVPPIGGAVIIDEESYKSLYSMFNSSDKENHTIGQILLTKCDIKESIYYIWKLARTIYTPHMVNLRTKAGRKFRDDSSLFELRAYPEESFARHLIVKDWMTPFIFSQLEDDILKTTIRKCNNKFYDVKLELKDEYKQYSSKQ